MCRKNVLHKVRGVRTTPLATDKIWKNEVDKIRKRK